MLFISTCVYMMGILGIFLFFKTSIEYGLCLDLSDFAVVTSCHYARFFSFLNSLN